MPKPFTLMFLVAALLLVAMTPLSVCLLCAIVLPLYSLLADVEPNQSGPTEIAPRVQHLRLQPLQSARPPPVY